MTAHHRAGRVACIAAAGLVVALTAAVAGAPGGVPVGAPTGAAGQELKPVAVRPVLVAGAGSSVLRGIAGGLRLTAGRPGGGAGRDGCVRRQVLIGNRAYLNGRSQTIRWTPGAESGLLLDRELWSQPAPTGALLDQVVGETAGSGWWRPAVSAFLPGWMSGTSRPALSTSAGTAAEQLATHPVRAGRPGPDAVVRAALDVAGVQYLDDLQRAALLDVLAGVPDVVLDGARNDLAGRRGLAFRFVASPNLLTVIIDQRTGEILAASSVLRFGDEATQLTMLYLQRSRCAPPAWTWQLTWPDDPNALFCCGAT